jgi:hypothetical protein
MSTRSIMSTVVRLVLGLVVAITSAACGGELLRTGRSPVYLTVTGVSAGPEGGELTSFLLSDVQTGGGVINDNVRIDLHAEPKNPSIALTAINAVTITRYHVDFKRTDGRNRAGIDVPYPIDGALSTTFTVNGQVTFELVRHQAKREPPLANMAGAGGLRLLTTYAEITLYGRDQNGNEVTVTAMLDVHFGDFADEE